MATCSVSRWIHRAQHYMDHVAADLAECGLASSYSIRMLILRTMSGMLIDPDISIPETAAGMTVFHLFAASPEIQSHLARRAREVIDSAAVDLRDLDAVIRDVVIRFEASVEFSGPKQDVVAAELRVSPSHLGRLLHAQTGLDWRQWRAGRRFRSVMRELGCGSALLKGIAIDHHWSSYEQFCHDFVTHLGVCASEFRRVIRSEREGVQVPFRSLQVKNSRSVCLT
jgi:AraC-like DNA-binding protein